MSLGRVKYADLSDEELGYECERVFSEMKVTVEESEYLFHATSKQSKSLLWFEYKKGRLTASNFGSICCTSLESPTRSLVDHILQKNKSLKTPALKWGINNEHVARSAYVDYMKNNHESFEISDAGLYINPIAPHLGASPDGMVSCSCCGPGSLEIKCPYSVRETTPTSASYIGINMHYQKNTTITIKYKPNWPS